MKQLLMDLRGLMKSGSAAETKENITPHLFDCVACIPSLLYLLSPLLVVIYAFQARLRIFILLEYTEFLQSILPGILVSFVLILVLALVKMKPAFHPVYAFFAFAMLWMLLSVSVNGWTEITLLGDIYRHEGILSYWGYIGVLFFSASLIREDSIKRRLAYLSILVSLSVAAFAVAHEYIFPADLSVKDAYPTAIFIQFNHYGYYLAIHILLASALYTVEERRPLRVLCLLSMLANAVVLNLNNTFGAWLACVFGFLFMFVVKWVTDRKLNVKALPPLGLFVVTTLGMSLAGCGVIGSLRQFFTDILDIADDPSKANAAGTTRWLLWKTTCGYIRERPLFGYGIEGIDDMLQEATGSSRTHNEYLQYMSSFGIPEGVAYILGCTGVFLRNLRLKQELKAGSFVCLTAAFTYLVSAFFGVSLYNTAPFLFIFLGLGYNSCAHAW